MTVLQTGRAWSAGLGDRVLRLHFTADDLARVRLAPDGSPMGEALMSLQVLRGNGQESRFGWWRHALRGYLPTEVRPVWDLVPSRGWIPDFLTPYHESMTPHSYLAAIRATPGRRITADLNKVATIHQLPGWVGTLTHGDPDSLAAITNGLAAYHDVAIAPHADRMRSAQDAERAQAAAILTRHGVGALLERLHQEARWQAPVLTLPSSVDHDVHLAGRGLVLAPMVFCGPDTRLWLGEDQALLAYPLAFDTATALTPSGSQQEAARALANVLGTTRMTVLTAISVAPGLTTADLATRSRISPASASEHATTLRQAGLITSHRDRNRVRHYPTDTATTLLNAPSGR